MDEPVAPAGDRRGAAATPGNAAPSSPTGIHDPALPDPTDAELASYRRRVADIAAAVTARTPREQVADLVDHADLDPVLQLAGDPDEIRARGVRAALSHTGGGAATACAPRDTLRIFLLQQIDLAWWRDAPDFATADDLLDDPGMERLAPRDPDGLRHQPASDALLRRAQNLVVRRWWPSRRPADSGLSYPLARPPLAHLLRLLAAEFRQRGGGELWINSLARPVAHQVHLQQLGFTAFVPSAHCRGWAADVEASWHARFGTRSILDAVVADMADAGMLNAIDEGSIWHVCPSPTWVRSLGSASADFGVHWPNPA